MRISGRERRLLEACAALVEVNAMRVAGNEYGARIKLPQAVAAAQAAFAEYGQEYSLIAAAKAAESLAITVAKPTTRKKA